MEWSSLPQETRVEADVRSVPRASHLLVVPALEKGLVNARQTDGDENDAHQSPPEVTEEGHQTLESVLQENERQTEEELQRNDAWP